MTTNNELMTHELKTDPEVFDAVASGAKKFEIRFDDRGFRVGDTLALRKTRHTGQQMRDGAPLEYVGAPLYAYVTHILRGPIYGLADSWVCMSIQLRDTAATAPREAAPMTLEAELEAAEGCFDAAVSEGLMDRLAEAENTEVGSLHDLVSRRLLHAVARIHNARAALLAGSAGVQQPINLPMKVEGCSQDNPRCEETVWRQVCQQMLDWQINMPSWFWQYIHDFAEGKTICAPRSPTASSEVPDEVDWFNAPLGLTMLEQNAWALGYNHCRMDMLTPIDEAPSDRMRVQDTAGNSSHTNP